MLIERSPKAREIILHTRQLLTSGGYNSFSYADIAELVQIQKASIHHHFPSKVELVQAVVAEYREEARMGMAALEQNLNDPLLELQAYIDYWSACISEGTSPFCICVMLSVELPKLPREISSEVSGHFSDLADWLTALLRKGEISGIFQLDEAPEIQAKSVMATVHGAMLAARALENTALFQEIVHPVINRLIHK
ncbi:TetR/AcrR family transcriptional regulator [Candidatus Pantoea floridensis]|uniref:Transcriptional regulator, TetR family n=1 Tax=Candidatus Pantoea floridensis TaxID=1938870 RepID=A0A286BY99_9GAMM|nr:TetR/AcrR family transcriptional regulator [Pantoea floridensis]PIF21624.1 TetR family transcriptional regulator [Enterobacteriaceae bacterium JKS000233]SOD39135.1 transcriptional regulator, TetR family [Pantoea floridensis]